MSDDLVAFLKARIGEDEATARLAISDPERGTGVWFSEGHELAIRPSAMSGGLAMHIVNQRPQKVLREVAAKRAIIRIYEEQLARAGENAMEEDRAWTLEPVISHLASAYGDHPDYRQEWAV